MTLQLHGLNLARPLRLEATPEQQQAQAARQRLDPGTLESLEKRIDTLRHQLPLAGTLRFALMQHLALSQRHHQTLNHDWFYQSPFSQRRRQELAGLSGGKALALQYGTTIAEPTLTESHQRLRMLRIKNETDTPYSRFDEYGGLQQQCMARYVELGGGAHDPVVFVNSEYVAAQLAMGMEEQIPEAAEALVPMRLATNLYAIVMPHEEDTDQANTLIGRIGGRPSPNVVMAARLTDPGVETPNLDIDNQATLRQLQSPKGQALIQRLREVPADHGHAAVSHTAARLIDNLMATLQQQGFPPAVKHSALLASGLGGVIQAAESLSTVHGDSQQLANVYQVMIEELHLCLAASKPYQLQDLHQAAAPILHQGQLPANALPATMRLTSCGMAALTNAFDLANELTPTPGAALATTASGEATPVYYELKFDPDDARDCNILFATLNQSLPGGDDRHKPGWNVDDVISALDKRLNQPELNRESVVLVLDATVENRQDMPTLLNHCHDAIASGQLKILLCKSYQKFANLGAGKVMAGGVGLISRDDKLGRALDEALADYEAQMNVMANPESQLLTHMLQCRDEEFNLMERATANTQFLARHCFSGQAGHSAFRAVDEHLPFAVFKTEMENPRHQIELHLSSDKQPVIPFDALKERRRNVDQLSTRLIDMRSSFGFISSTYTNIDDDDIENTALRLSLGQETQAELIERFYQPSRLMHESGSHWSVPQARNEVLALVNAALEQHPQPVNAPTSLTQKLAHIARAEQPAISNEQRSHSSLAELSLQSGRDQAGGFTLNKIASVLLHLAEFMTQESRLWERECLGPDRPLLDELLGAMIHCGMPGVSQPVRQHLTALQTQLRLSDLRYDPEHTQQHLADWLNDLERLPGHGVTLGIAAHIPARVFEDASRAEQERLVHHLLAPLDLDGQLLTVSSMLAQQPNSDLAEHMLASIEQRLDSAARQARSRLERKQQDSRQHQASLLRQQIEVREQQGRTEESQRGRR
ncbi:hypothetical protein ACKC9G_17075 [Pokkaliibacter sp. CJK22405]|uniref:hypothetical protein n=1 Tax=Pokkaliibacter sp. CJK22405 TaxID=3384615 RepID=UPI0039848F89